MRLSRFYVLALAAVAGLMEAGCAHYVYDDPMGISSIASDRSRLEIDFNDDWRFIKGDPEGVGESLSYREMREYLLPTGNAFTSTPAVRPEGNPGAGVAYVQPCFDDSAWRALDLPHDWGIEGPFDQSYNSATGKLPWWGVAWYRKSFNIPAYEVGRQFYLDFDGAMSYASVWVNGQLAGGWPFGYASWRVDITPYVKPGEKNVVAVRLDNPPKSSRWYPGGGIYRNVRLVMTEPVHVAQWGVFITTPEINEKSARVKVDVEIDNDGGDLAEVGVETVIYKLDGNYPYIDHASTGKFGSLEVVPGDKVKCSLDLEIKKPVLWSVDAPERYIAVTRITSNGVLADRVDTPFGVRTAEFTANDGFHLNGERLQLNGVCMHHDLGALGSAMNTRALQRQLETLKDMGGNAIRTSHNPPAPELIELCDRMGIVVIAEAFDCWAQKKTRGDYNRLFNDWSEQDMRSLVRHYRNHPSVVLWSIGNEIREQWKNTGPAMGRRLTDFCHQEDPSRPTTVGASTERAGFNGYQKSVDVFGINYFHIPHDRFIRENPAIPAYFSESSSCVSTRGEYFFPVSDDKMTGRADFQVSSYDMYAPKWANVPDLFFKALDEYPQLAGEFVWTGFDYIGEPTPYNNDVTNLLNYTDPDAIARAKKELDALGKILVPSRSSYFGIVDLAGFRKDRFYLYQARWRPDLPMAHLLPHWTWPGREGEVTPVHVYTSGDEAELFLNGKSLGRKRMMPFEYRIRWDDVVYEPGELKVVAYKKGKVWAGDVQKTAGPEAALSITADRADLNADGDDLVFVTVKVLDANGVMVPRSDDAITFEVTGPGDLVVTGNGDPTSHASFQSPVKNAFNGMCLAVVRTRAGEPGDIVIQARGSNCADSITVKSQ